MKILIVNYSKMLLPILKHFFLECRHTTHCLKVKCAKCLTDFGRAKGHVTSALQKKIRHLRVTKVCKLVIFNI